MRWTVHPWWPSCFILDAGHDCMAALEWWTLIRGLEWNLAPVSSWSFDVKVCASSDLILNSLLRLQGRWMMCPRLHPSQWRKRKPQQQQHQVLLPLVMRLKPVSRTLLTSLQWPGFWMYTPLFILVPLIFPVMCCWKSIAWLQIDFRNIFLCSLKSPYMAKQPFRICSHNTNYDSMNACSINTVQVMKLRQMENLNTWSWLKYIISRFPGKLVHWCLGFIFQCMLAGR